MPMCGLVAGIDRPSRTVVYTSGGRNTSTRSPLRSLVVTSSVAYLPDCHGAVCQNLASTDLAGQGVSHLTQPGSQAAGLST